MPTMFLTSPRRIARRLKRSSLLGVLLATGLFSGTSVSAGPSRAPEKYTLANGLEVILEDSKDAPVVTVNLWYHVGSKDEAQGKNGFAHLFEHVMFQGSKNVPEDTFFKFLERVGASEINGTTNTDRTNYFETVPKNQLELALWLESDRMGSLLQHAGQETFASQREVVKNERRQNYENAPYGALEGFMAERLYPEAHPYHLLTIGTPEDLDRASLEDVKKFFNDWYRPNNASLAIVGDIDKPRTKALVEKYFGSIVQGKIPRRNDVPEVKLAKEETIQVAANVELPRVDIRWPTPALFAKGDGELDLFAHVLSSGKGSRLRKRLVDELQIAQSVTAYQASRQLGSEFEIMVVGQKGKTPQELLAAVDNVLLELRQGCTETTKAKAGKKAKCVGKVTADELKRAATVVTVDHVQRLEKGSSRANLYNTYNQIVGRPDFEKQDVARYQAATLSEVEKAVETLLPMDKRLLAFTLPDSAAPVCGKLVSKGDK